MFIRSFVTVTACVAFLATALGCSGGSTGTGTGTGAGANQKALFGDDDDGDGDQKDSAGDKTAQAPKNGDQAAGGTAQTMQQQGGACRLERVDFGTDACAQCQATSCCSAWQACDQDLSCIRLYNCISQCQSQDCVDQCAQQYDGAVSKVSAVYQCRQGSCASACQ